MTDIERKAWELANSVGTYKKALCRVIEQHEAFKQEVSDAVGDTLFMVETHCDGEALARSVSLCSSLFSGSKLYAVPNSAV